MAATVQMNTRIDSALKASGDAILKRNGYTPSSAVQALWSYIAESNSLPSFMPKAAADDALACKVAQIEEDAGLAIKMQERLLGIPVNCPCSADEMPYDELREMAWEERGTFDD